jgi:hypothetical protein
VKTKTKEEVQAFLTELSALTAKHRIAIGGCGCCGSPYLDDITDTSGSYYYTDAGLRYNDDI